ncbi:hypothetical protein FJ945_15860 [Mesorhizobium sp. B2-4-9]|uniref:hypothetical protein n=1 Tax=Mesorhizobium sp. B2-4-9 TaxID=2589940 RepID=UPI001127DF3F|nr:hypothetical protein [Mesorhizobium sp. B2-4-9]TPL23385.1 hypothetical protein FJ945_15860 [Mesorhizobium sp. B2-4-9]
MLAIVRAVLGQRFATILCRDRKEVVPRSHSFRLEVYRPRWKEAPALLKRDVVSQTAGEGTVVEFHDISLV